MRVTWVRGGYVGDVGEERLDVREVYGVFELQQLFDVLVSDAGLAAQDLVHVFLVLLLGAELVQLDHLCESVVSRGLVEDLVQVDDVLEEVLESSLADVFCELPVEDDFW